MFMMTDECAKRFWAYAGEDKRRRCWIWTGSAGDGYGAFQFRDYLGRRNTLRAHRIAWMLANKRRIPKGKFILHSCDTPLCCNPKHLRVGTAADNVRDMMERGRHYSQKKKEVPKRGKKEEKKEARQK